MKKSYDKRLFWLGDEKFPLYLAPMAGVTDVVFRDICKDLGANVMTSEFVSAEGILYNDERTQKYIKFSKKQHPVGIQLFGGDGDRLALAAEKIIHDNEDRPDFIDLNFGCPVKKVVAKNGGSSMLKDLDALARLTEKVVSKVDKWVPVTAKIRIGWDEKSINAMQTCKKLQNSGVRSICIHGRTRAQGYGGRANWDIIEECAQEIKIPIIGNGDISNTAEIAEKSKNSLVNGLMIGRSAISNPWIFQQKNTVSLSERWGFIIKNCKNVIAEEIYKDEKSSIRAMRSRLMTYTKSMPNAKALRTKIAHVSTLDEIIQLSQQTLEQENTCANFPV